MIAGLIPDIAHIIPLLNVLNGKQDVQNVILNILIRHPGSCQIQKEIILLKKSIFVCQI